MPDLTQFLALAAGRYELHRPFIRKKRRYYTDGVVLVGEKLGVGESHEDTEGNFPEVTPLFADWPKAEEFAPLDMPLEIKHEDDVMVVVQEYLFNGEHVLHLLSLPELRVRVANLRSRVRLCFTWQRGAGVLSGFEND